MPDDPRDPDVWPAQSGAGWSLPAQETASSPAIAGPRYQRTGLIGRGGMGLVYAAWDHQLGRSVAIKEADPTAGPEAVSRLEQEARLTAGLDHPGIVPVHDVGIGEDGRVFYAMRLVRGQPLAARIAEAPDPRARLALVRHLLDAAQAIAHAHAHGVVHRDLKPANLVLGELGETQVIDWGLARATGAPGGGGGTPGYARPEQVAGAAASPRDDVYALGVTLVEILGGGASHPRPVPPQDTPPELAAIARRALDPAGYADARDLARDLADWLDGRPVAAHRYSPVELAMRFVRAWRVPLAVAGVSLAGMTVVGATAWSRTIEARDQAQEAELRAREALALERGRFATVLSARAAEALADTRWPEAGLLAAAALDLRELPEARGVLATVMASGRLPSPLRDDPSPCPAPLGLAADGAVICPGEGEIRVHDAQGVRAVTTESAARFLTDDRQAIAIQTDRGFLLRALDDGALLGTVEDLAGEPMAMDAHAVVALTPAAALVVHPIDGSPPTELPRCATGARVVTVWSRGSETRRVVFACSDGAIWDGDGRGQGRWWPTPLGGTAAGPVSVVPLPGETLAISTVKGELAILEPRTGALRFRTATSLTMLNRLRVSPDGQLIAAWGSEHTLALLRTDTGRVVARLSMPGLRDAIFLDDRRLLLLGDRVQERRLPDELPAAELLAPAGLSGAQPSPDGRHIAAGLGDGSVVVWSLPDGVLVRSERVSTSVIKGVAWLDDTHLAAASAGPGEHTVIALADATGSVAHTTRSVVGTRRARRIVRLDAGLLSADYEGGLTWTRDGVSAPVSGCEGHTLRDLDASPDGLRAIALGEDGLVLLIEADPPRCVVLGPAEAASSAAIADDGTRYLGGPEGVTAWRGAISVWETPLPQNPYDLDSSPDGRWVASGGLDGSARLFEAETGRLVAVLQTHSERVASVSFSPDSRTLYTASWDARLRRHALDALTATPDEIAAWAAGWNLNLDAVLADGTAR